MCCCCCLSAPGFLGPAGGDGELLLLRRLSWLMILTGAAAFLLLQFVDLPYGRFASRKFGFPVHVKLAWCVQEAPAMVLPLYLGLCSAGSASSLQRPNLVLLSMFTIHYIHRAFMFPFLIRGGKATPFIPFILAFTFCVYNGYLQGRYLSRFAIYPADWITDPRFLTGLAVWLSGLLLNVTSDHILRNLRKPGETGYKIPRGGMFEYVTGANFLGEIVEWTGFAIACWSLPSAAFAVFTFMVLISRASQHHRWYLEKFEDYPTSRKALIPFLY
ncbi:3-oxo-5-alpha-steroid 4-dehydrogenase 1 [Callorhinchus milii]|uniref:3-oxo-5-alpha-steroid 4-dehydrogenase n=2 Tax=Callorhinchus milii TaxID=7868 RepID=K4FYJ5_CALMI|nr:3-oxo-5-alpha-steroid 4-dehydrogenase 1 [Callorhinchus milii]AFK11372.1 steroid-5-alpha-reductase alpha polypeptide 1 [Callorhinchus milii]|eukprot:gi/632965105/ref/XP_007898725.1/ PREDICTED: 3-oxo-5-alpha-steroid 4-dehydrogenase 1 [Callorhinchus milii]